jgi:hypothetical protein
MLIAIEIVFTEPLLETIIVLENVRVDKMIRANKKNNTELFLR